MRTFARRLSVALLSASLAASVLPASAGAVTTSGGGTAASSAHASASASASASTSTSTAAAPASATADLTAHSYSYLEPFWEGDTVYHETVMFYAGRTMAKLAFPIKSVVSVRSYDLQTEYVAGRDYIVEKGRLVIPAGSQIPVYENVADLVTCDDAYSFDMPKVNMWEANSWRWQVCVTYKHTKTWKNASYQVKDNGAVFDKLRAKFESGAAVNVVAAGDSIVSGWEASRFSKKELIYKRDKPVSEYPVKKKSTWKVCGWQSLPTWGVKEWARQVVSGLKDEYGNKNISYENVAISGTTSDVMADETNYDYLMAGKNSDLFILGYGMNEFSMSLEQSRANYEKILSYLFARDNDATVLLVSPFVPNMPNLGWLANYEQMLYQVAAQHKNVGVAPVYSMCTQLLNSKKVLDYGANELNHPNDFMHKVYAQVCLAAMDPNWAKAKDDRFTLKLQGMKAGKTAKVDGAKYRVVDKQSVVLVKAPNRKKVIVPARVRIKGYDYKVTGVQKGSFSGLSSLQKVSLGKYVATLEAKSFYKVKSLKKVVVKNQELSKKAVKNSFKGSKVGELEVRVPGVKKKLLKSYKGVFGKKNLGLGKKAKVKVGA